MIRFQIPLQRTNGNLHRLSQQIIAREMLFKRRIRLVSELRTQNDRFLNIEQMVMMKQEDIIKPINNAQDNKNSNNSNNNKKPFFSSLVGKNESVEAPLNPFSTYIYHHDMYKHVISIWMDLDQSQNQNSRI